MKLKTSFFNVSVLKKDITRFMPVWGLYFIFMLMGVWTSMGIGYTEPVYRADALPEVMHGSMPTLNFLYAVIVAAVLFGDLYVPRMCNALHAMPMRREGWFLTHTAAGLLFSIVPNLLIALILCPLLGEYAAMAFYWLGASTLQYVFFFGLALLCAMCAGSRLGMIAIYGMVNFFSYFLLGLLSTVYVPLLYGVELDIGPFQRYCPVFHMSSRDLIVTRMSDNGKALKSVELISSSWNYLYLLAGIGVLLTIAAVLIYRRRHLECAGDLLAVRPLTPVFLVIGSLASGMVFYLFTELFSVEKMYVFLFLGIVVGYFVCRMLLERTTRVFRLRSVIGAVVLVAVMAGSMLVTDLDPMKIISRVPQESEVESCCMNITYMPNAPFVDTPEEIREVLRFHEAFWPGDPENEIGEQTAVNDSSIYVQLTYHLKDGSVMKRNYWVRADSSIARDLERYTSSCKQLLGTDDLEKLASEMEYASFDWADRSLWNVQISPEQIPEFLEAVRTDCNAGNMSQLPTIYPNQPMGVTVQLTMTGEDPIYGNPFRYVSFTVYEAASNTMEIIRSIADAQP